MKLLRSDLPIADDASGRFLPWLVAVMVFLATLAMGGALSLDGMVTRWNASISGVLTVQVPPASDTLGGETETEARVERVVRLLSSHESVASARAIERQKIIELIEPWLGSPDLIGELPVPRLIEVDLKPNATIRLDVLLERLRDVAPGTLLDDHRVWLSKLIALAETLRSLALAVLALVGTATAATVVYATRNALAVHRPHVEVLHLIGATDAYIAKQLARRALFHGLLGGCGGVALALPVLITIGSMTSRIEGGLILAFELEPWHWALMATLPVIAGVLAQISARRTVRRQLTRML